MSRSVDLFIGARLPIEEVAAALARQVEVPVEPEPGRPGRYLVAHEDASLLLHAHPYVDDEGLPFRRYPYALSAAVPDGRPQDSTEAAGLRRLAQRIQQGPGWPVLLVLDLQFRDAGLHAVPQGEIAGERAVVQGAGGEPS